VNTEECSQNIDTIAPGYEGELKVLASLVLTELYPMLASSMLRPSELWVNARLHPEGVWVGHTTWAQEAWWEVLRYNHLSCHQDLLEGVKKAMVKEEPIKGLVSPSL
jgi:hypothetical protein